MKDRFDNLKDYVCEGQMSIYDYPEYLPDDYLKDKQKAIEREEEQDIER